MLFIKINEFVLGILDNFQNYFLLRVIEKFGYLMSEICNKPTSVQSKFELYTLITIIKTTF